MKNVADLVYEFPKVVTMKSMVLWVTTSQSSETGRRFEEHITSNFRVEK
jgi:hypothetical protein